MFSHRVTTILQLNGMKRQSWTALTLHPFEEGLFLNAVGAKAARDSLLHGINQAV